LAVVLLAQLTAVLPRDPDRVLTLLWKAGIVNNQRLRRTRAPADSLKGITAHRIKHRFVRPWRVSHKVMQPLVFRAHPARRQMRRHRLDALTLNRQHQPGAVATKRFDTVGVPKRLRNQRHVFLKPLPWDFHRLPHWSLEDKRIMPYFLTQ
jgi:hypothetical protein